MFLLPEHVVKEMNRTDFERVKNDIKETVLSNSKPFWPADYGNYGPLFVRLTWHASGSFREDDGRGGADGGRQRFDPERSWRDNTNLDKARRLLVPIKEKYGAGLSWGDLIVLAGNAAIEQMGGPILGFCGGRIDETTGKESYMLGPTEEQEKLFPCNWKKEVCPAPLGTAEVGLIYVNPEGPKRVPNASASAENIRDVFGRMNMNDTETVALIGGGHEFGKAHGACEKGPGDPPNRNPNNPWAGKCGIGSTMGKAENTVTSGIELPWTPNPTQWNHEYFKFLLQFENKWTKHKGPGDKFQWKIPKGTADIPTAKKAHGIDREPIGMLTTDIALLHDVNYASIVREFAKNQEEFNHQFKHAWYKLTTRDMGPRSRCINKKTAPEEQPWQNPLHPYPHPGNDTDIQMVRHLLMNMMEQNPQKIGLYIRLSWQCSSSFRTTDYLGGCNGARIRHKPQNEWPVNTNLKDALDELSKFKNDYKLRSNFPISTSDLIVLAGNVALQLRGAGKIKLCNKRRSEDAKDNNVLPKWLKPTVGKEQKEIGNAFHKLTTDELLEAIRISGLTKLEYAALYGAGYVVGDNTVGCNGLYCLRTTYVKDAQFQRQIAAKNEKMLSNAFFKLLYSEIWQPITVETGAEAKEISMFKAKGKDEYMLANDLHFKNHPELDLISKRYARNNDLFLDEFKKAWIKISNIDMFEGPTGNRCNEQ